MRLSRDVCSSLRDVTPLSRDVILHCFAVKQCRFHLVYEIHPTIYHKMCAILCVMYQCYPISCRMWSSRILKQTAYHRDFMMHVLILGYIALYLVLH